jgi:hypothetical protein
MVKLKLSIIFIVLSIMYACNDKENLFMSIEPSDFQIQLNTLDTIYIKVHITSPSPATRFVAYINKTNGTKVKVLDTTLSTKKCNFEFIYGAPTYLDTTQLTGEFTVYNSDGDDFTVLRSIEVCPKILILQEYAGCVLYSENSTNNSGYNLLTNTSLMPSLSNSNVIDIRDSSVNDNLGKMWFSPKKGRFVKYNGFDYANATNQSVKATFKSGSQVDLLTNINKDDVILYGNDATSFYCVMKITAVSDEAGSENDKYEFNLKK